MVVDWEAEAEFARRALLGKETVAYVAGIVDGEGCISVWTSKRKDRWIGIQIFITNTNVEVLDFCQKVLGGVVKLHYHGTAKHKTSYRLSISSRSSVKRALEILLPYLIIKKKVAVLVIELIKSLDNRVHGYTPRDLEVVTEVKKLNRRGL